MQLRRAAIAVGLSIVTTAAVLVAVSAPVQASYESGIALPPGPAGATPSMVSFVGDQVWAAWTPAQGPATVYRTADDGTGTWQVVNDPETGQPVEDPSAISQGVIVTAHRRASDYHCIDYRFASAAGVWQSPSDQCWSSVETGPGGKLLKVYDVGDHSYTTTIYDLADGSEVGGPYDPFEDPGLVGTWMWRSTGNALVGHDASGAEPDRRVPLRWDCQSFHPGVAQDATGAQWALQDCIGGLLVVPLTGPGAPLMLQQNDPIGRLGNGFTSTFDASDRLTVRDLSAQLVSHTYGPGHDFQVSVDGAPRVAWTDGDTIRVAHLDWLGQPPTAADDTIPPTIGTLGGSAAVVRGPHAGMYGSLLDFTFSATDNLPGVLGYEVQVAVDDGDFRSEFLSPDTSFFYRVDGFSGTVCFRVRAVDRVGNYSAYSDSRCSLVDQQRPVIDDDWRDTWSRRHVLDTTGRVLARSHFHATVDTGVTSYDVQRRVAKPGEDFGAWTSPPAWQATTATLVTRPLAHGARVCFRARARDAANQLSGWGDRHCFARR